MADNLQTIGTRTLTLGAGAVTVELYAPTQSDQSEDYQCGYQITGLGNQKIKFAYGVDSMQALILAMQSIGTDLYASEPAIAGRLNWLGMRDLGFPVPTSVADLVPQAR